MKISYSEGDRADAEETLGNGVTYRLLARDIRRERTGIHALVAVAIGGRILESDVFNLGRAEDRQKLAKKAHTAMGPTFKELKPLNHLIDDLLNFCLSITREWEEQRFTISEVVEGVTQIEPLAFILSPYLLQHGSTIMFAPPGAGKALDDTTPVLTTKGWRQHGELAIGDYVFGLHGLPKKILFTRRNPPRPSMVIRFSDGESIIADKEHEWLVECDREKNREWNPQTRRSLYRGRSAEILETQHLLQGQRRAPAVAIAAPIEFPEATLPIDPYVLGIWIGDGISGTGSIATSEQDIEHFGQYGKPCKAKNRDGYWRVTPPKIIGELRKLGILQHRSKRIPSVYQTSSYSQRLSLLQGIMDTDGYVDKRGGMCELVTVYPALAEDYVRLISSLGIKVSCRKSLAKLKGRVIGPQWRLTFYPSENMTVFRLRRKRDRQRPTIGITVHHRYIVSVEPAGLRSMQCIEVAEGQYLAGRALILTHNSYITQIMAVCVATGMGDIWPVQEKPAVYVNLERSQQSLERREMAIRNALGLVQPRTGLRYIHARGSSLASIARKVRQLRRDEPDLVVFLDSVSRAQSGSLNEDEPANRFIDTMNYAADSWFAIGHTPRADATHLFGSQMFDAGEDLGVKLTSERRGDSLGICLTITKANDIGLKDPEFLALEFENDSLVNIRSAQADEFPDLVDEKRFRVDTIADYLLAEGACSATQIAKDTGLHRPDVVKVLRQSKLFRFVRKEGKSVLYGVVSPEVDTS